MSSILPSLSNPFLKLLIIPLLYLCLIIIINMWGISGDPEVVFRALTIDLLVFIPAVYFLLIRKTTIPNITVVPVMLIGFLIGSKIIPDAHTSYLEIFRVWVLPIIELSLLGIAFLKVRKARALLSIRKRQPGDFYTVLKSSCQEILPGVTGQVLAMEAAVIYYGIFLWKSRELKENEFSIHKNSGATIIYVALLFLLVVETFIFHLVIMQWSTVAAWVLSTLSIYTGIQLFGLVKSVPFRPVTLDQDQLILRYGIANEIQVSFSNIEHIEPFSGPVDKGDEFTYMSILSGLESYNLVIRLKEPIIMYGLYGIRKQVKNVVFFIDDKERFQQIMSFELQKIRN